MNQVIGAGAFLKRNVFNLSHSKKFSMKMGVVYPVLFEDVIPGDTFKVKSRVLMRFSPMVAPVMEPFRIVMRYFFVPYRTLMTEWEQFITGGKTGNDTTVPPYTVLTPENTAKGTLRDYFGCPSVTVAEDHHFSALLPRAYYKIWNEWLRDEDLQNEETVSLASGNDINHYQLLRVGWEKDYFTSCRPAQQRGNPLSVSLGTSAPVVIPNTNDQLRVGTYHNTGEWEPANVESGNSVVKIVPNMPMSTTEAARLKGTDKTDYTIEGTADLSSATAVTIAKLRELFQLQRIAELCQRAGVRLTEYILAFFGVHAPDQSLQRSQFLGGGVFNAIVSEVLQTSQSGTTPQGNQSGHGIGLGGIPHMKQSFVEHGVLMGLMYVLPKTQYQQGISRIWTRTTRFDFYNPALAHLSEQAVLNKELYCANDGHNDDVFGYNPRYDELRRRESSVHGDMRDSLAMYHAGRIFTSRPALNDHFVATEDLPTIEQRLFASGTTVDPLWVHVHHDIKAIRPIPKLGEPGLIDHM